MSLTPPRPSPRGRGCEDLEEGGTFCKGGGLSQALEPPVPEASLHLPYLPAFLGRYAHHYLCSSPATDLGGPCRTRPLQSLAALPPTRPSRAELKRVFLLQPALGTRGWLAVGSG